MKSINNKVLSWLYSGIVISMLIISTSALDPGYGSSLIIHNIPTRHESYDNYRLKYIGLLVPIGPSNYEVLLSHFHKLKQVKIHNFTYQIGTMYKIPVIICIQPFAGVLTRALSAQVMVNHFHVKALLYPGTSGSHLPLSEMHIGDIVIGTENVNYENFYMNPKGQIKAGEYSGTAGLGKYQYLYINPLLERYAACAALSVKKKTKLPHWINGSFRTRKINIFYYGIQGTSLMWVTDMRFMKRIDHVFHAVDEDGDWYSALVARMANVPFIEVSTITDSPYEFPGRGLPPTSGHVESGQQIVQNISDRVILKIIKNYGRDLIKNKYPYVVGNPYPWLYYRTPLNPRGITNQCDSK